MGKIEREHEDLLLNALAGLVRLHQDNDIFNDREALNKVNASVMMMESLLFPYMDGKYNPELNGDEVHDLHARIRGLLIVARDKNLVTPRIMMEDLEDGSLVDL